MKRKYAFLWDYNQEICSLVCDLIDIHPHMEGTTEYCMEFVPGEVDFRETIHPKRDWREADADFCLNLTIKFLMPNTVFCRI